MPSKGQELVKRADLLIEEEFKAMAAEERRRAVLEGLAGLGYEVSKGMATAWVQNGQIVIRKQGDGGRGAQACGARRSCGPGIRGIEGNGDRLGPERPDRHS
ncbi:hypothetical protein [Bradyrhizobium japonicum]|uniref:hypothetical protein n=1 Tax=Bradyrhizobium japonicum TaxID=375 RepID=UPI0021674DD3|nr:hypothetical protein [Bradyrhizobium japonicum]